MSARLICFPYAGGGASIFRSWQEAMPAGIEVCGVQLPGREHRIGEPPLPGLDAVVTTIVESMASCCTNEPFAFFGHSVGALVSFEVARELRLRRMPGPQHMFVSGCRAPHTSSSRRQLHALPTADLIPALREMGGTPEELLAEPEFVELWLPTLRADTALIETYRYTADRPLACSMTAFAGAGDQEIAVPDVLAWQEHTEGAFAGVVVPGDHFFVHSARDMLLEEIRRAIALFAVGDASVKVP